MIRQHGFTLIELAIVIAIVGILAAVAVPRFINQGENAELTTVRDFQGKLTHAYGNYTLKVGHVPSGFQDFVTKGAINAGDNYTLSMGDFGKGKCSVSDTQITCPSDAFSHLTNPVVFTLNGGVITGSY